MLFQIAVLEESRKRRLFNMTGKILIISEKYNKVKHRYYLLQLLKNVTATIMALTVK